MVEFASGWYVRGDVAYAQETFPKIAPDFAFGGTQSVVNGYSVGTGFGYKVNDWFRTDLVFDFRDRVRSAGIGAPGPCILKIGSNTCYFDTTIERLDLLANGYLDLGTWQGFTPYIGAGAGVDWARIWQNNVDVLTSNTVTASNQFAWAAMAGVAFQVAEHLQLDAGYRFVNLGHISGITAVTGIPVTKTIFINEVRGGLRYMID
jgi:opacity protein-like surface antigen